MASGPICYLVYDNPKWITRQTHLFNILDSDRDGKITIKDFKTFWVDHVVIGFKANENQAKNLADACISVGHAFGLEPGVTFDVNQYVKGVKELAIAELQTAHRGEVTMMKKWLSALFDVVDANHDGSLSFTEWKNLCRTNPEMKEEEAQHMYDICDLNHDGRIDLEEFTAKVSAFWYTLDDSVAGLFGTAFV